jgi:hypothetical protein
MTTRYGALVEDWSVWFVPVFDFTRLPGLVVSLSMGLDTPRRREEIRQLLLAAYPDSLEFGWGGFDPIEESSMVVFFVYLQAAAAIEELQRTATRWPGVAGLEASSLIRIHSFPSTFDELVRARLGADRPGSTT